MEFATLEDQEARLVFPAFTEETALTLGMSLVTLAKDGALPVVISIRTANRTLFHCAMPGAAPLNDLWVRRKSNTALLFQHASLLVGARNRAKGQTLAHHGLDPADYADNGGSFPIRVRDVGVVAVVTVSGLPQVEDHALVIRALEAML